MAEKKRKRHEGKSQEEPRKKPALGNPPHSVKVSVIEYDNDWIPILSTTPGFNLPSEVALKRYTRTRTQTSVPSSTGSEILLYSSDHPKLEYTAREEVSNGSEGHLKHYVGVYDPENGSLRLVQARTAIVRSTLRSARSTNGNDEGSKGDKPSTLSARSNLGLAFGTKKAQKAIRALTTNAIQASPSKSKGKDSPEKGRQLDPLASAVVSSMAESTTSMPTREEMQAEIDENKPRPKANTHVESVNDVYPLEQLAGGANVLATIGVKDWIDKVKAGEDVQTKSRYVARRLRTTAQGGNVKKLKAMRYLLLLIDWFMSLKVGSKSIRKVPQIEAMGSLVEAYGSDVVNGVARRFADGSQLNKWHIDNLITHILALAISLDNFTTDTHDIREDLKLESKDISKYYAELGGTVAAPTDSQRDKLGITKAEASSHRIAALRLPLVFPKMRIPMASKKRK